MRYSLVVASALAIGALASPIDKRRVVTEVATQINTVTVYVTEDPGAAKPTEVTSHNIRIGGGKQSGGQSAPWMRLKSTSISSEAPALTVSTTSQVETPPQPVPTAVTSYALVSSEAPAPSSDAPAPSSEAPAPSPEIPAQSSEAPAPTPSKTEANVRLTGPAQATLSSGPEYQAAVLYHHNAARANHGAGPLVWDTDCQAGARRTADTCTFRHPKFLNELKQGQNLFATSSDAFNVTAAITESWYKNELPPMMPFFGRADIPDDVFHEVGHLTQLVWKNTTKVGCVSVDCGDKMRLSDGTPTDINKFTICNYAEPGNWAGKYQENVQAPMDASSLGSWSD